MSEGHGFIRFKEALCILHSRWLVILKFNLFLLSLPRKNNNFLPRFPLRENCHAANEYRGVDSAVCVSLKTRNIFSLTGPLGIEYNMYRLYQEPIPMLHTTVLELGWSPVTFFFKRKEKKQFLEEVTVLRRHGELGKGKACLNQARSPARIGHFPRTAFFKKLIFSVGWKVLVVSLRLSARMEI